MGCCDKAKSSIRSMAHGAKSISKASAGIGRADEAVVAGRRSICRSCDKATRCKNNVTMFCKCTVCGCMLKAKTSLASERCPLKKW